MSSYSIALFLHVTSAIGFFVALALEAAGVRRARLIGVSSMVVVLLSGFFMVRAAWHHAAWIEVTLATLVVLIAAGLTMRTPRLLMLSLSLRAAMTVGIVFLMTVKPGFSESLTAIAVAAIIGVVSAVPAMRTQRGRFLGSRA